MKKLIWALLIFCFIAAPAFAGKRTVIKQLSTGAQAMADYNLTSGLAVTTDTVLMNGNVGFATLYVKEDKSGGAGDVDIYAIYKLTDDGATIDTTAWSRPYISNMAGTATVEGNIVTALGNTSISRSIVFTPRLGTYIKIVFDPDADSQISASLIWQEEY